MYYIHVFPKGNNMLIHGYIGSAVKFIGVSIHTLPVPQREGNPFPLTFYC